MATVFTYWMAFRVKSDATEQARRDSIYHAIDQQCPDGGRWYEPTSFGLVQSGLTAADFVRRITRGLDARKDLLIAGDVRDSGDVAYFGAVTAEHYLLSLLPLSKKI